MFALGLLAALSTSYLPPHRARRTALVMQGKTMPNIQGFFGFF
jgi:hypothetical protein